MPFISIWLRLRFDSVALSKETNRRHSRSDEFSVRDFFPRFFRRFRLSSSTLAQNAAHGKHLSAERWGWKVNDMFMVFIVSHLGIAKKTKVVSSSDGRSFDFTDSKIYRMLRTTFFSSWVSLQRAQAHPCTRPTSFLSFLFFFSEDLFRIFHGTYRYILVLRKHETIEEKRTRTKSDRTQSSSAALFKKHVSRY